MSVKAVKPKKVAYELIRDNSEIGRPMYERLYQLIDSHHEELSRENARVALAWSLSWNPDVDGRLTLGKCKKATELDRELAPFDFVILLNRDVWQHPSFGDVQKNALLDHELMHAAVAYDANGEPKRDERKRTVFRIRKHDLEEFRDVVARHGLYKDDLASFARVVARAEAATTGVFIGPTRVQAQLQALGIAVDVQTIATWDEPERRAVQLWASINADVGAAALKSSLTIPAVLQTALGITSIETVV